MRSTHRIAVIDERHEIFPICNNTYFFETGTRIDVMSGCNKTFGIDSLIRTMTPTIIAVDEITAQTDVDAMVKANGCGVLLIATAHASNLQEMKMRPVYKYLLEKNVFHSLIVLREDASWHSERIIV